MPERLLVSLDDAAAMLSLSRRSVQALVYAGGLPSIKVGRSRRIVLADLEAFVDELRLQQAEETKTPPRLKAVSSGGQRHGADPNKG